MRMRTLSLPRVNLMRVGLPLFGSTSITLDAWIGIGLSIIWPFRARCVARRCRFTRFKPSSTTLCSRGKTRTIVLDRPLSFPVMTMTLSPLRNFINSKHEILNPKQAQNNKFKIRNGCFRFCALDFHSLNLFRISILGFRISLYHFRGKGRDFLISALDKLARNGPEDSVRLRFFLVALDQHRGVLVEANVRAVFPAIRFLLPNDDCAVDIFFLHLTPRLGCLDGEHYFVSQFRIALARTSQHFENPSGDPSRVVGYLHYGAVVQHMD